MCLKISDSHLCGKFFYIPGVGVMSTVVKDEVDSVVESVVVEEVEELVVEVEVGVEVELSVVLVVKVDSIPWAVMVVSIG